MFNIHNKWVIRYNEDEYIYKDILDLLPELQNKIESISKDITKICINFDNKFDLNHYYLEKELNGFKIILNINRVENKIIKTDNKIQFINQFSIINTKKVNLLYPALATDKRWNSIELPASSIYLGSALTNNDIKLEITKLILPSKKIDRLLFRNDVIGISIFEDLFIEINNFLEDFSKSYSGLIVGGGPMVTLSPLQTAYHLNKINLLIRGEAEMIFPDILNLLAEGNLESILLYKGFVLNLPGLIVLSDIDFINRPDNFQNFNYNLDFAKDFQLIKGLEINISRGCKRSCIFCSKVQGKDFRKVEPEKFEKLLIDMNERINNIESCSDECRTLNINDDDILQNKYYAEKIFKIIKNNNFKIWGIQTSIQSFFIKSIIDDELIEIINDNDLFVSENPLIWLGTDAFLKNRGKRLAKFIPDITSLRNLIITFEDKKIKNIHYWISSDPDSTWNEFIHEFILIDELRDQFKYFDILAHAPFLIPYSSTPLNNKLIKSNMSDQVKYKQKLKSKNSNYDLYFAEKVITKFKYLNKLLSNEIIVENKGFFDYIKKKDRFNSFLTIYNFLKKERIESEADNNQIAQSLKESEELVENVLSTF